MLGDAPELSEPLADEPATVFTGVGVGVTGHEVILLVTVTWPSTPSSWSIPSKFRTYQYG